MIKTSRNERTATLRALSCRVHTRYMPFPGKISTAAAQFLDARAVLARAFNTAKLEQLDEQLRDICSTDPDTAIEIMQALSSSDDIGAKEAVAIYVKYLFPTRQKQAVELANHLQEDQDPYIRERAQQTISAVTSSPELSPAEAAELTTLLHGSAHA